MKFAFFAFALVAIPASALAAPPAALCFIQAADVAAYVSDFRGYPEDLRFGLIDGMSLDFAGNVDAACAKNYLDVGTGAKAALTTENVRDGRVLGAVNNLLNQANEQYARYSPLSANVLTIAYRALSQAASRYRVIEHWGNKISDQTDINMARRLREFFQMAREVSVAAADEEYISRSASRYEAVATQKVIELGSNATMQFPVPVADMTKALNDFRAMSLADRFLLVQYLTRTYGANPTDDAYVRAAQTRALTSILDFSRRIVDVLKTNEANEAFTIAQNTNLATAMVEILARKDDLTARDMQTYYGQLVGSANRFAVITYWSGKIAALTAVPALEKLVAYFALARQTSESLNDDAYIRNEASAAGLRAQRRIIDLSTAPAFVVPVVDQVKALADFRAMALPQRFLVIKKLSDDYVASTDARALVSIFVFAKAAQPVLVAVGEDQAFIAQQNDVLINQTVELLARSATLSADDLMIYFKELRGQASRLEVIKFFGLQIDTASTAVALNRLVSFFGQVRRHVFAIRDEAFVAREAQSNELRARQKLAQIP